MVTVELSSKASEVKFLKHQHLRAGSTGRSMGERGQPGLQDTLSHKTKQQKRGVRGKKRTFMERFDRNIIR